MLTKFGLLAELRSLADDCEQDADMGARDVLAAVAGLVAEGVKGLDPDAPVPYRPWADERAELAVQLATERGAVTSAALATAARCTTESARTTLRDLVKAGALQRAGGKRGRGCCYVL